MKHQVTLSLLIVATAMPLISGAVLTPFGPPLESAIASVFVPPTRSGNPYIATAGTVYRWNDESNSWDAVYALPWSDARILGIAGYRKSSKVLYVVHTSGVARSSDGGDSWIESVPTGFPAEAGSFTGFAVNPNERSHALLVTRSSVWETVDYGLTWTNITAGSDMGKIVGADFLVPSVDEETRVLLATKSSLFHYTGMPLSLDTEWRAPAPINRILLHPVQPVAFVGLEENKWTILSNPMEPQLRSTRPVILPTGPAVPNRAGASSLWIAADQNLLLASLIPGESHVEQVQELPARNARILPHPDDQDSIYLVNSNQLSLLDEGFEGLPPVYILPAPMPGSVESLVWVSVEPVSGGDPTTPVIASLESISTDMETALRSITNRQPPFDVVLQKAIRYGLGQPADFAKWEREARQRHWLPELRIEGGYRQRNTDDHLIIEGVDQFGIPQKPDDLNLPDRIRTLGYAAVVLQWDLYDLLFDDQQVDIRRERRYTYEQRRELIENLSKLYHTRIEKIAEKEGLFGTPSPQRQLRLLLEISEVSQILNGFCGEELFR